jgi:hypothetical protein
MKLNHFNVLCEKFSNKSLVILQQPHLIVKINDLTTILLYLWDNSIRGAGVAISATNEVDNPF